MTSPQLVASRAPALVDINHVIFPQVDCPLIPLGNRILVQVASPTLESDGGIILPSEYKDWQKWTQKLAKVISLGSLAYRDRETCEPWPEGAWCQPGDFLRVPQYGGDRVEIPVKVKWNGKEVDHIALFATIADRDAYSKVKEGVNPLTLKSWL